MSFYGVLIMQCCSILGDDSLRIEVSIPTRSQKLVENDGILLIIKFGIYVYVLGKDYPVDYKRKVHFMNALFDLLTRNYVPLCF